MTVSVNIPPYCKCQRAPTGNGLCPECRFFWSGCECSPEEPASTMSLDAFDSTPRGDVRLTRLSDVVMQRPRFAWDGRIPLGALSLIAGVPGQGKSTFVVYLGARITRGQLEGDLRGEPRDVVIASAEDAATFILAPRFAAAGADMDRVHVVHVDHDGLDLGITIPDDLAAIGNVMERVRSPFLIVDPLLAHIPVRIDGYKDQHVRVALAPLARLAEELEAAMTGVMHLNKREQADLFSRIGGSGGFLAAARSGFLIGADPHDETRRVIVHGKSNLAPEAESLSFMLEPIELPNPDPLDPKPIVVARVAMLGASNLSAADVLRPQKATAHGAAMVWLTQLLNSGPMPERWIEGAAETAGHAWRTVRRAKEELGIESARSGFGKDGRWEWKLP
jgi:AAA domain